MTVTQPDVDPYTVSTTQVSTSIYGATATLRAGGSAGPATIRVSGTDANGGSQSTTTAFTVK